MPKVRDSLRFRVLAFMLGDEQACYTPSGLAYKTKRNFPAVNETTLKKYISEGLRQRRAHHPTVQVP